jgi:GMP synthase-like glutamine amidotransferase
VPDFCERGEGMILIINICKEKLHYYEFVKPVEDILKEDNIEYFVKNYKDVKKKDLERCKKVIICGTSLFDNEFIEEIELFNWVNEMDKSVLGICGGMQIIGLVFGGKMKKQTEIGFYKEFFGKTSISPTSDIEQEVRDNENFKKGFLGLEGLQEVYHLHNNSINFEKLKEFEVCSKNNKIVQAVKHRKKELYGVLFHPEVRQKALIKNFCLL